MCDGGLREFGQLSAAIVRMANGLADFAKFIPTDLVRTLLADGVRAVPGGETRELTVMFADVAGFSALTSALMEHGQYGSEVVAQVMTVLGSASLRNGGGAPTPPH